ncbi:adenylyl-sulfate kinase, partial [Streptomyces desertarenae]
MHDLPSGGKSRTPQAVCTCRPGATVWLTGLPSAGKTTIARALADRLRAEG